MFVKFLDILIGSLLMGGIYALIAVGFSLQYGVARVLNVAHGEFLMLGAFAAWSLFTISGINPIISLVLCAPVFFLLGFLIHIILFKHLKISAESLSVFEGNSMLASFGLMFIVQNLALSFGAPL
jgi:branched-chain amino acid transport system permease protein